MTWTLGAKQIRMLDFNHGSLKKAGPLSVSEIVNNYIDGALMEKRAKEPPRLYLGASQIGDPCERKLQYSYSQTPKDPKREFTAKQLRIFATGHHVEDMTAGAMDGESDKMWKNIAAEFMTDAGFVLERFVPGTKPPKQFGFSALGGKFKGHTDGRLIAGPPVPALEYPAGWECKGLNQKNWSKVKKHGVREVAPVYYGQLQTYIPYMELPQFLFTAFNKNTSELHHEIIGLDSREAQSLSDKAVRIIEHTESGNLLPRIASNPDFYLCLQCDWPERCWKKDI